MSKAFDLWSASDVVAHGDAIAARLHDGSMPRGWARGPQNVRDLHELASWRGQVINLTLVVGYYLDQLSP